MAIGFVGGVVARPSGAARSGCERQVTRSRRTQAAVRRAMGAAEGADSAEGKPSVELLCKMVQEMEDGKGAKWEESLDYKEFMEANKDRKLMRTDELKFADAMEFFRQREGSWTSWRASHHLAFRRDETGASDVKMNILEKDNEEIVKLCEAHGVKPEDAQGGCYVTWEAVMAWDQEGENHKGSTTFALVPDADDVRKGRLLRDRGYAEVVPIVGTYSLDDTNALNLTTPYDGGEVVEQFWFDGPDIVHRMSWVSRFGGFTNATFASETRSSVDAPVEPNESGVEHVFGSPVETAKVPPTVKSRISSGVGQSTYGRNSGFGRPTPRSAFGKPQSSFGPPSARLNFDKKDGDNTPSGPASQSS